eukprot:5027020-Pyramimonas_sp.AAC.1
MERPERCNRAAVQERSGGQGSSDGVWKYSERLEGIRIWRLPWLSRPELWAVVFELGSAVALRHGALVNTAV